MACVSSEVTPCGPKKRSSTLAPRVHGHVLQGHARVMGLLEDLFR